jgi:hypothetical protein
VIGVDLSTYEDTLTRVAPEYDTNPVDSFDAWERIGAPTRRYCEAMWDAEDFPEFRHSLPLKAYMCLSTDELFKIRHSTHYMMDESIQREIDHNERFALLDKITSSMWRWGCIRSGWNEFVDAYEGIRSFDLGLDGFEVRLDHATYHNECGWSKHSRTFLDGAFAYLVYHRGEHVMTIGFSLAGNNRLLIQQVQMKKQRGNRWLFRWPTNRLEHIIDRFRVAFPATDIYVVDGGSVGAKNLNSYLALYRRANSTIKKLRERMSRGALSSWDERSFADALDKRAAVRPKIRHLRDDLDRLTAQYRDAGRYLLTSERYESQSLIHYRVDSSAR